MSKPDNVYSTEQDGQVLIVIPASDQIGFRVATIDSEATAISERIDGSAIKHVLFDAENADYLSSSVIGSMIQMWEAVEQQGGTFAICNLSEAGLEALAATRLDTKWPRYDSREEGLRALRSN